MDVASDIGVSLAAVALAAVTGVLVEAVFRPVERPLKRFVTFWLGSLRTGGVQRVEWPTGSWLLDASMRVFDAYDEEQYRVGADSQPTLKDTRAQVQAWLEEDATTTDTEELYLVAQASITRKVVALLYATLYKEWPDAGSRLPHSTHLRSQCMVWYILTDVELPESDAIAAAGRLCTALERWAKALNRKADPKADLYFQCVGPTQGGEDAEPEELAHRRRYQTVLAAIGAKVVLAPFLVPDTRRWERGNEYEGILLYKGGQRDLPALDTFMFVHGTAYLWDFDYPTQVTTVSELAHVVRYFESLLEQTGDELARQEGLAHGGLAALAVSRLRLADVGSPEARALGLC